MGDIGGKLLFALKRLLQPVHHPVKGIGELMQIIPAPVQLNAAGQIHPIVDAFRRSRHLADRPQKTSCQKITPDDRHEDKDRDDQERQFHHPAKDGLRGIFIDESLQYQPF